MDKRMSFRYLAAAITAASLLLLFVDSQFERGVADGELYIVLVLIGLIYRDKKTIVTGACLGTVLTGVGFYFSAPGGVLWMAEMNRGIAIIIIWVTAVLCLMQNRISEKLVEARNQLEARVRERTAALDAANKLLQRESAVIQLQKDVAVASNENQPFDEAMRKNLTRVCREMGWPVGHLYFVTDEASGQLAPSTIWHLENPAQFAVFRSVTEATPLHSGEGLPGRVMASGKPVWIMDVTQDTNFPRAKLAIDIGVKSGLAFPIMIGARVVGVLEFFSEKSIAPDNEILELMSNIGTQLGRVVERHGAENALKQSRVQLRELYQRIEQVREEERTRIAREVHDELGQVLTTMKLELSLLNRRLAPDENVREKVSLLFQLIDNTIQTVKRISTDLRPPILDVLGLSHAIRWQSQEFQNRSGVTVDFNSQPPEIVLSHDLSTTAFRVFQEALTNVVRHAQAKTAFVNLINTAEHFILQVKDDGVGITEEQTNNFKSLGILGMRERVRIWGGRVDIQGKAGEGTTLTVEIPHQAKS